MKHIIFVIIVILVIILILLYSFIKKIEKIETYTFNREKTDNILRKHSTYIKGNKETPIYIIDNFLTGEECQKIIDSSHGNLVKSSLTKEDINDKYFRTSKTCYFNKDISIQNIVEEKIINKIQLNKKNCESSQIQYYTIGNEFKPHCDYFNLGEDDEYIKIGGQRTWTFMIYLNDVEEGGCTRFINLRETIYPKKGTAVVWCNLNKNGTPDSDTQHQGMPVDAGEKWIITKWFLEEK